MTPETAEANSENKFEAPFSEAQGSSAALPDESGRQMSPDVTPIVFI